MFCPECGKEIPDNSKFCFRCGTSLEQVIRLSAIVYRDQSIPQPYPAVGEVVAQSASPALEAALGGPETVGQQSTPSAHIEVETGATQVDTGAARPDSHIARRESYIVRHWRGELSFRRSYWVNGVIIFHFVTNVAAAIAVTLTVEETLALRQEGWQGLADLFVIAALAELFLILVTYVWALVGVWRAASRYQGKKVWAVLAKIQMCLGAIISLGIFLNALTTVAVL